MSHTWLGCVLNFSLSDGKKKQGTGMKRTQDIQDLRAFLLLTCCYCWLVALHHATIHQGQICLDNFMCCNTEIEVADHPLTAIWHWPTSPSVYLPMLGTQQGSHWSTSLSNWRDSTWKKPDRKTGDHNLVCHSWGLHLTFRRSVAWQENRGSQSGLPLLRPTPYI